MEKEQIKILVERMLEREPKTRNDDNYLWFRLMEDMCKANGKTMFIPFEYLSELRQCSIFRCRQIIQNVEQRYLPTDPEVRKQRRISEDKWLEFIRANKTPP